MHCMNDCVGALESVAVLWRLRNYRDIIIIIIIIIVSQYFFVTHVLKHTQKVTKFSRLSN